MAGSLSANLMSSLLRILRQAWGLVTLFDRLRQNIPTKGRISVSLEWDFWGRDKGPAGGHPSPLQGPTANEQPSPLDRGENLGVGGSQILAQAP